MTRKHKPLQGEEAGFAGQERTAPRKARTRTRFARTRKLIEVPR
jgi:hypothetical protein